MTSQEPRSPSTLATTGGSRRQLLILGLVGFVTSFGAHAVAVNLPSYAARVGAGTFIIGLLIAVYDFAEVLAKPVFGYLADKRGQVVTLWLGLALFSLASLAFLIVDPRLLVLIRLAQGLGAAAFSVISVALVAASFPTGRGQALGVYNALKGAGYVLGPTLGGLIVARSSFDGLFVASAAIGFAVLALSLTLREPVEPAELDDDDDEFSLAAFLAPFADRRLLPWYGIIVLNMFFVGILFGFVPVLLHRQGYGPSAAGFIVGGGTLAYLLVQPLAGWLADGLGARVTILCGLVASAVSLLALPFSDGALLVAFVVFGGLGIGVVWTNSDTMVSQLARPGQRASTLGAAGSYKEVGDMLGPLSIGGLAQLFGLTTGFVACGLVGLAGASLALRRPHERTATEVDVAASRDV